MKEKRTYASRKAYMVQAVSKRRKRVKEMVVAYKGGACTLCGYHRYFGALELHHKNGREKSFAIGDKGYTRSWEKVKAEADKCVLLCANCHREVSAGIVQLPSES